MLADKINNYYQIHKDELHKMFKRNEDQIDGRICHPSIICIFVLLKFIDIENYMEIGVHNGGSMSMVIAGEQNVTLYGIDLFEDIYDKTKHFNDEKFKTYQYFKKDNLSKGKTQSNLNNLKKMYDNNSHLTLIQGNTYFDETEKNVRSVILDNKMDILFIDGDHTYDGVKNDFERYHKYVKTNGYIIFDDYHHPIINKYVDELLLNNKHLELIVVFQNDNTVAKDIIIKKLN
jgi:predicted O-methyltransferase YrrM